MLCKIKAVATAKGLAFVDAALLSQIATTGISANGLQCHLLFIIGGGFQQMGYILLKGYALIISLLKQLMQYGSNLKGVDIGNYRILFQKLYSIRLYNLKTIPLGWF
jgi:hypothetical protein